MKKKFLIVVHNLIRDGPNLVYLKVLLEKEGFDVKLTNSAQTTFFTLNSYLPHILILGQIEEIFGASMAKYANALGTKVIIMPTEGIVNFKNENDAKSYFTYKHMPDYNKYADLWLCWSTEYRDALVKYPRVNIKKTVVCGCPRFDIYKKPLINTLMNKETFCIKYNLDVNKKIITFPTHFTYADVNLKHAKNSKLHCETPEFLKRIKLKETKQREVTTKTLLQLAKDLPEINFIIKVHPWEDAEYYFDIIKNAAVKNIKIIKNEYIGHVIKNTDIWLNVDCTTAKEATFMQTPVITLAFLLDYIDELDEFSKLTPIITSYKELYDKVISTLNQKEFKINNKMHAYLIRKYYKIDGRSTQRCLNAICKFISENEIHVKRKISIDLLSNIVGYDLQSIIKDKIYANKTLRQTYLTLIWKKSNQYIKFMNSEMFNENFETIIKRLTEQIRNVINK